MVLAAVLAACGGGGTTASDTSTDTASATSDNLSSGTRAQAAAATDPVWVKIATEYSSFTVSGTQTVRFGSGSSWVTKQVTGSGKCNKTFFGSDPHTASSRNAMWRPTCRHRHGYWHRHRHTGTGTGTGTGATTVTATVTASRVTGAPLAVLFDATGTTNTSGLDSFRQLNYAFNFGDDRGLVWSVSGLPKNTETSGPVAAHVFDVAGTYTVTVKATNPSTGRPRRPT
jgi:hypothetical protein